MLSESSCSRAFNRGCRRRAYAPLASAGDGFALVLWSGGCRVVSDQYHRRAAWTIVAVFYPVTLVLGYLTGEWRWAGIVMGGGRASGRH